MLLYNSVFPEQDDKQIKPSSLNVSAGSNATFHCNSYGGTRWFYEVPHSQPILRKATLIVHAVTKTNSGEYFCYGLYRTKPMYFISRIRLHYYSESVHT